MNGTTLFRKRRKVFDELIHQTLGGPDPDDDITEQDPDTVTPEFELYADRTERAWKHQPDAEEIHRPTTDTDDDHVVDDAATPSVNDEYINATGDVKHKGCGC